MSDSLGGILATTILGVMVIGAVVTYVDEHPDLVNTERKPKVYSDEANIVFTNGKFYSMEEDVGDVSIMAISKDHICYIGNDMEDVHTTDNTKFVDLSGKAVTPSLVDKYHVDDSMSVNGMTAYGVVNVEPETQGLYRDIAFTLDKEEDLEDVVRKVQATNNTIKTPGVKSSTVYVNCTLSDNGLTDMLKFANKRRVAVVFRSDEKERVETLTEEMNLPHVRISYDNLSDTLTPITERFNGIEDLVEYTVQNAKLLKMDNYIGSLKAGKKANFNIYSDTNVSLDNIEKVYFEGEPL